jgi:hypothetical protein
VCSRLRIDVQSHPVTSIIEVMSLEEGGMLHFASRTYALLSRVRWCCSGRWSVVGGVGWRKGQMETNGGEGKLGVSAYLMRLLRYEKMGLTRRHHCYEAMESF